MMKILYRFSKVGAPLPVVTRSGGLRKRPPLLTRRIGPGKDNAWTDHARTYWARRLRAT
jgi:hypothetical protein